MQLFMQRRRTEGVPRLVDARRHYDLPFRFIEPRSMLVLGSGGGNDVAAAVRRGVPAIDAVEIDPVIVRLGEHLHPEKPYQIAMGTVLPKINECRNLLVPIAVSSSHIAYGSIRMEPVFMILGQSAANMASMAIDHNTSPQKLDYVLVKQKLEKAGQVLEFD